MAKDGKALKGWTWKIHKQSQFIFLKAFTFQYFILEEKWNIILKNDLKWDKKILVAQNIFFLFWKEEQIIVVWNGQILK